MKSLYININNEQIQSNEELEVLNYDLDSDFFFYLGEKVAKGCKVENENALITDFNTQDNEEDYKQIIAQWNELKNILFSEECEGKFELTLPSGFTHWLRYNEKYNTVYDRNFSHGEQAVITIDLEELHEDSVEDLQRKIIRKLQRDDSYFEIDEIVFNDEAVTRKSPIVCAIKEKYNGIGFKSYKKGFCKGKLTPRNGEEIIKECTRNENGEYLIKILKEHRYMDFGIDGISAIQKDGKWGFIDKTGNQIIPCLYDSVCGFHEGLAAVQLNNKWGAVNNVGELIIPYSYNDPLWFDEGLAAVRINGKDGYINTKGELQIPCIYDNATRFKEGYASVELNGKLGYIDRTGKMIIPCMYDISEFIDAHDVSHGYFPIYLDGKWGMLDKQGHMIIPCKYDQLIPVEDNGECIVILNDKEGYINIKNEYILPLIYDRIWKFSDGIAPVKLNGKCIYIDKQGTQVIPYSYEDNYHFKNGVARVKLNDKYGYIDLNGNQIIPCAYDSASEYFYLGIARVKLNNKYGYIDTSGKHIIPLNFTWVRRYDEVNIIEAFNSELGQLYYYDLQGCLIKIIDCGSIYICEHVYNI